MTTLSWVIWGPLSCGARLGVLGGALVTSERSRPGARSEAAKKEESAGGRGARCGPGGVDMMAPGHGGRLYGGNRGREGGLCGAGAGRDSGEVSTVGGWG